MWSVMTHACATLLKPTSTIRPLLVTEVSTNSYMWMLRNRQLNSNRQSWKCKIDCHQACFRLLVSKFPSRVASISFLHNVTRIIRYPLHRVGTGWLNHPMTVSLFEWTVQRFLTFIFCQLFMIGNFCSRTGYSLPARTQSNALHVS